MKYLKLKKTSPEEEEERKKENERRNKSRLEREATKKFQLLFAVRRNPKRIAIESCGA